MKRLVLTFTWLALLLGVVPGALAAPPAKHLGQAATGATAAGPCACTALQFGDLGLANASYLLPFDGVITKSGFYIGEEINTGDSVQVRAFRRAGSNHATVTGDGATHLLPGLPTKAVSNFYERMPVSAGDVLGGRFKINSGFIGATPVQFTTNAPADEVGATFGTPTLGETFETGGIGTKLRVNVEAVLEPDEDHDGYGDLSQDLCSGSPVGGGPCSGSLFGSDFQQNHGGISGSGFDALYIQRSIGGVSTAVPFDGVVVRWRLLGAPTGDFGIRIVGPTTGSSFQVLHSSSTEHVVAESSPTIGKVTSFATRLPIPAGGYVGLATPSLSTPESVFPTAGSSLAKLHDGLDGTVYSEAGTITAQEFGYDADIEPDVDHDGYGDITQDSCPSSAAVHEGSCPSLLASSGGSTDGKSRGHGGSRSNGETRAKTPRIASIKPDKRGGYAVKVKTQQAGTITAKLTGKLKPKGKVAKLGKAATKRAARAGTYTLTLKPPKAARELKVKAKLVVTLAPSGFLPAQASKSFKLK